MIMEAIQNNLGSANGDKFDGFDEEKAEDINNPLELLVWYCDRTHKALLENEEALEWLKTRRGITLEDIREYRIGCVGHGWVKDELDGAKRDLALRIGLLKENDSEIYDAFWNRIIFPVWVRGRIASIWTRKFPQKAWSTSKRRQRSILSNKTQTEPLNSSLIVPPELTRKVLIAQAKNQIFNEENLEQKWRCAQVLLRPLQVIIPFAEELARQFPVEKVRARRDFPRLLALIEASALLHQEQRTKLEVEGTTIIVASVKDFDVAYEIINPILSQVYKELSPREEALTGIIKEEYGLGQFADPTGDAEDIYAFGVQELLERIKKRCQTKTDNTARDFKGYNTLRKYLKKLVGRGIVEWNECKGVKSKYILINDISHITFDISLDSWAAPDEDEAFVDEPPNMMDEDFSLIADGPIPEDTVMDETISHTLATEGRGSSFLYGSLENSGISPLDINNTDGSMKTTLPEEYPHSEICECDFCLGGVSNFEKELGQFDGESNEN